EADLAKPEQVEVVNQEGGDEHDRPAAPEDGVKEPATHRIRDVPEHGGNRPPLPGEETQREVTHQDVGAPLNRRRDEPRPPSLNTGRAITLCGTAKRRRSSVSRRTEAGSESVGPESIDFGTRRFPTKPTAYRN